MFLSHLPIDMDDECVLRLVQRINYSFEHFRLIMDQYHVEDSHLRRV